MQLLNVLYPIVAVSSLKLFGCRTVTEVADVDPRSLTATSSSRLSLVSNPFITCWSGEHVVPGTLAAICVACHVVAIPVWSLTVLRSASSVQLESWSMQSSPEPSRYFCGGDYRPSCWWFRHMNWALVVLVALQLQLGGISLVVEVVMFASALLALLAALSVTARWRPYRSDKVSAWTLVLRGCTLQ